MAKLGLVPVRRGYWGNKIGKVCAVPAVRAVRAVRVPRVVQQDVR
jgi:hypothetical protein